MRFTVKITPDEAGMIVRGLEAERHNITAFDGAYRDHLDELEMIQRLMTLFVEVASS